MPSLNNCLLSEFQTPQYFAAWFSFGGDRMANRLEIENYLKAKLNDPTGRLVVNECGPWWKGEVKLAGISYAHSNNAHSTLISESQKLGHTILVFSLSHELGVDVESEGREFQLQPEQIAKRYFHENEQNIPFLELWLKKEAYAKASRLGLAKTIHFETAAITQVLFKTMEKTPAGYRCTVCVMKPVTSTVSLLPSSIP